jgi:hypothetical protein
MHFLRSMRSVGRSLCSYNRPTSLEFRAGCFNLLYSSLHLLIFVDRIPDKPLAAASKVSPLRSTPSMLVTFSKAMKSSWKANFLSNDHIAFS